ncbi:MAG: MerR family transcriptional regulator [Betaproteobacteria bacterium]|nr:MerR family transcriptional regulator [Betaproteobacteria bacterium]
MLIGELANRTECSRDTIRFYEKLGLVAGKECRGGTNNYRHYDEQMAERVLLIKKAKLLGFTLTEIKDLMVAWEANTLSPQKKIRIFQDKIAIADRRIAELKQVKRYLQQKLKGLTA